MYAREKKKLIITRNRHSWKLAALQFVHGITESSCDPPTHQP